MQPIKVNADQLQNKDRIAGRGVVHSLFPIGETVLVYYTAGIVSAVVDFANTRPLLVYRD